MDTTVKFESKIFQVTIDIIHMFESDVVPQQLTIG